MDLKLFLISLVFFFVKYWHPLVVHSNVDHICPHFWWSVYPFCASFERSAFLWCSFHHPSIHVHPRIGSSRTGF